MNITAINSTDKAKKKIKTIAKANHLQYDLVYAIFSFYWNYDGVEGEWVNDLDKDPNYHERFEFVCKQLGLDQKTYTKEEVLDLIYNRLQTIDKEAIFQNFLTGATEKNYCAISPYASYHYLANATKDNLNSLILKTKDLTNEKIIWRVFCKIFRGGSVDRYNLDYLFADLVLDLPFENQWVKTSDWTADFIKKINADMKLTDLVKTLKEYCKGDKYTLQTILEALSYSGILQVKNHPVSGIFIPDFRDKLSNHYPSNEWTYPLRFWTAK